VKSLAALALCAGLALAAAAADDDVPTDQDRLQGVWKLIALESDGKKAPDEVVKAMRLTVKGDKLYLREENKEEEAPFKLDPSKTPRTMDLTVRVGDKTDTVRLIYELKGDELKLCGGRVGKDRPSEFATRPGSGLHLLLFRREKD